MIDLKNALSSLVHRVRLTIGRGVIRLIDNATGMQNLQIDLLANEVRSDVGRMQEYGFTSHPHPGSECAVVFVGGNRDHGICIAVDDRRYRLKGLVQGEVALYTDEGDFIHLKRGNNIAVKTNSLTVDASDNVTINTSTAEVNASDSVMVNTNTVTTTASTKVDLVTPNANLTGRLNVALGIGVGSGTGGGDATINGNVSATGDVSDGTSSMQIIRNIYNTHTHPNVGQPQQKM